MKMSKTAKNEKPPNQKAGVHIGCKEKHVEGKVNTKFLGLQIDNHINWKSQIEQKIPKLSVACYAVMSMVHIVNIITIKSIYNAHFRSII